MILDETPKPKKKKSLRRDKNGEKFSNSTLNLNPGFKEFAAKKLNQVLEK